MQSCSECGGKLSLLGLLYKHIYPQYLCSKCHTQYLEVPTFGGKTLIISRESKEAIDYCIRENEEVLRILAKGDGHPREEHCRLCGGKGWVWHKLSRNWYPCADCNDSLKIPKPKDKQ